MKHKIENVYYTPDEINQYNQNKSVYIYLFSKNLKKNINNLKISNFITNNYIIDIYYIDTYIKYYDDIINKKVNLIIYYDVKTINNFTKLINVLIKYPPRYYTYIYIHYIFIIMVVFTIYII